MADMGQKITCPTPATRNCPDFAKAKEFTNPTCVTQITQVREKQVSFGGSLNQIRQPIRL